MVTSHRISARLIRHKYLKDLFVQWRGLLAAYDEGLARGSDAVLATAVWRNVFKADEDVDLRNLAVVVSYLRGILKGLESLEDEGVTAGEVVFGDPGSEMEGVLVRSRMMDEVEGIEKGVDGKGKDAVRTIKAKVVQTGLRKDDKHRKAK